MTEKLSNEEEFNWDEERRIRENIGTIREKIAAAAAKAGAAPESVVLEAVTKTKPVSAINAALRAGVKVIGENKVQELTDKLPGIDKNKAEIHLIGHLQTNKVRMIIEKADMIESLDSVHLAAEIDKRAARIDKIMKTLIEINIGGEESKSGIRPEELESFCGELTQFRHIEVCGLMTVAPICENESDLHRYFGKMRDLFIDIKKKKSDNINIGILSMGMSSDFSVAIEEGANLVRIGTAIFGKRNYVEAAV